MYKPKPLTNADIDKFIADLESSEFDEFKPIWLNSKPVQPLGILWAIAGGLMFSGAIFTLIWILYGIYEKVHGGIR